MAKKKVKKKKVNKKKVAKNSEFITHQSVHEANKREAFDAMRAYHNSEIAHKKDAVEILKAVLTATILVYGGLIGLVFSEKIDGCLAQVILIGLLGFILVSVYMIVHITNKKIDLDHKRYTDYAKEYVEERKLLKLDEDLKKDDFTSVWISESISKDRTGHKYTKDILITFGVIIVCVAFIGSLFVYSIIGNRKNESKKESLNHHRPHRHKLIR